MAQLVPSKCHPVQTWPAPNLRPGCPAAPNSLNMDPNLLPKDAFPRPRPPTVCDNPSCEVTQGLQPCTGCNIARYCSPECQQADQAEHELRCQLLQTARKADDAAALALAACQAATECSNLAMANAFPEPGSSLLLARRGAELSCQSAIWAGEAAYEAADLVLKSRRAMKKLRDKAAAASQAARRAAP